MSSIRATEWSSSRPSSNGPLDRQCSRTWFGCPVRSGSTLPREFITAPVTRTHATQNQKSQKALDS
eukprot:7766307-Pyramimonas_sp.AAC.1